MPSTTELGQRIKQKYPGQYDDVADADLGAKVKAKYPGAYDDFTDSPAAPVQPKRKGKTAVESVGDALGMGDFGRGLGVAAAQGSGDVRREKQSQAALRKQTDDLVRRAMQKPAGDPSREALLKTARDNFKLLGDTVGDEVKGAPSNAKFLTSGLATLVNFAGAGTVGAKAAGSGVVGTTRYLAQPLKVAVAQSAGQAGALAGLKELGEGKSAGHALKAGVGPAALAGGITGLLGLVGKGIQKATEKGPAQIYDRAVPLRTAKDTEKVIRGKATPVAPEAVRLGIKGSSKQILQQASDKVDDIEKQLAEVVAPKVPVNGEEALFQAGLNTDLTQGPGAIARAAEEMTGLKIDTTKHAPLLQDFLDQTKVALKPDEAEAMQRALSGRLNEADALTVRRIVDTYLPKNAYGLDMPNNAKTVALKRVADDLRRQIADVNPEAGKLLTEQSKMIRLRDAASGLATKESRRIPFSRVDALMGGGAAASFALGNPLLGAALVGLPVARAISTSPGVATRLAVGLDRTGRVLNRGAAATDGIRRLIRAGLIAGSSQ